MDARARRGHASVLLFLSRDGGKGLRGKQQGNQAVRSDFAPGRAPQKESPVPAWEEVASQAALNQPKPPSCLQHQGARVRQSSLGSASQTNFSSLGPGRQVVSQQAIQGHGHSEETHRGGGDYYGSVADSVGDSQEEPRCRGPVSQGHLRDSGQIKRDQTMSYTNSVQFLANGNKRPHLQT